MQPRLDLQADFWNALAADYVDARSAAVRAQVAARLARVPVDARPAPGTRLLDVGAGTGAIVLAAVSAGTEVTALDVSPVMLARLSKAAAPARVRTIEADWRHFDPRAHGCERAFDLVYAQMVPSLREPADFARMQACSRGWCVFIGWGRERHDAWLEAAFAYHGAPWEVPPGLPLAIECLSATGVDVAPRYWREAWPRPADAAAAARDAAAHLRVRGIEPDTKWLAVQAQRRAREGTLADPREVEIGCVAWRATR